MAADPARERDGSCWVLEKPDSGLPGRGTKPDVRVTGQGSQGSEWAVDTEWGGHSVRNTQEAGFAGTGRGLEGECESRLLLRGPRMTGPIWPPAVGSPVP